MRDKFSKFSLPLLWIFAFLVIIFMLPFVSRAADTDTLPFQSNFVSTYQPLFNDYPSFLTPILTHYNVDNIDNCAIFIYEGSENSSSIYFRTLLVTTDNISNFVPYNEFNNTIGISDFDDFKEDYFVLPNSVNTYSWRLRKNLTECYLYSTNPVVVSNSTFFGNHSLDNYNYFTYCYPIYVKGSLSLNNQIVLTSNFNVIDVGVAIVPPTAFVPDYPSGSTAPTQVPPTFTSSDYTWTTAPTFDGSSVDNALGSIGALISWLSNNLKEEFKNLTDNLEGFFKYIGDTIQYYGNAIIDTLNNFIQNFYDNMSALVQPIFEKIAYITEEVDTQEISASLNNTSFVGLKNQFTSFFTTFENAFDISEPSTFTLTINIQNIDTFYNFGCRSPVIIHLDEHFTPIKTALRTFLWILISFGSVFVVERGLSDWIRGENDTK